MTGTTAPVEDEKHSLDHLETLKPDDEAAGRFSAKEGAAIRRRIDIRLLPCLGLMYFVSLMDRKNVANAAIAGMREDLDMLEGYRYSLMSLVFFITYTILQPPMTVLCRKIGPRIFLPGICILWGCVIIGFGFSQEWTTLLALRLILGIFEAGYFPGCVYLLSTWYTRFEVARRYSVFYLIGSFGSACSGIIAYGLMQMEGVEGLRGWRWIFIIEGVITCAIAIFAYIFMIRFPDEEREKSSPYFLKPDECQFIIDRLEQDRGDVEIEEFNLVKYLQPALHLEVWGFAFIFFCTTTVSYAFSYFLPIILRENLNFSLAASQCLIAPPYAFSAILMYATSWVGDRYRVRGIIVVANSLLGVIGLCVMGFHADSAVKYFGVFLAVGGVNANIPAIMTYQANNIRGQWKRAFCSATLTGMGGIGGIAGSLVFRTQDRPDYVPGMMATIVCSGLVVLTVGMLSVYFRISNKKADKGEKVINDDPDFRYTI
ncbi:hypothetical protein ASPSYDRAFT_186884 [Aspergillus sydowii CBS 593.65]|uniref:Major facilitator superfamily (MFS) profile domain-containing protein n=1 Tax=Aspergillus sydowii CBS 593.65 TaxID=1036612 RepID=A0A1L9T3C6_9EURO|nr:uncharacterized protein ASPSYDRAFT_186884 [Aspergillus sydowii CBS 593.65]OJJ53793.1 hypothetical protein ASPSYDRAFT_186884 [Aspergillus sydowii CBS 593.65]